MGWETKGVGVYGRDWDRSGDVISDKVRRSDGKKEEGTEKTGTNKPVTPLLREGILFLTLGSPQW